MKTVVTLSLISHTNAGKTTLARTLLRRDVGEVRDQPHTTEEPEAFTLLETPEAVLRLWDTPGFGNLQRLLRRLRHERDPLGWFLHQVWDRVLDRSMWCSQRAAAHVKRESDVVLYLVNASEQPQDAAYVEPELQLLEWIGRPVLVLLNQLGPHAREQVERWRAFLQHRPVVRDVLALDAFTRCWVEETALFERLRPWLPQDKRPAMDALAAAWQAHHLEVFGRTTARLAAYLARAAADRERVESAAGRSWPWEAVRLGGRRRQAVEQLARRLERATRELMHALLADHGLAGDAAVTIERRVQDAEIRGVGLLFDERTGAILGGLVSGLLSGLAADLLSGGFSLGGGAIAGGVAGALGGAALGRGYRWVAGEPVPEVRWSEAFLERLARQALLRYLAVAHHGRGRGPYRERELPSHWIEPVERAVERQRESWKRVWSMAARDASPAELEAALRVLVEATLREILAEAYPRSRALLGAEAAHRSGVPS